MGGYVTVPVGVACKLLGIPLILHEQNAIPGLSNRLLRPLADQCFSGFPGTFKQASVRPVGNPVRPALAAVPPYQGPGSTFNILIFGGSLGAQSLNEIVPQALRLIPTSHRLSIVHQTGDPTREAAEKAYRDCPHEWRLENFIEDMPAHYAQADLIIARSGALTVSEIATVGRTAIFIPYPRAVDDHQTANAMHLVSCQAALCVQEKDLTSEALAQIILHLMTHPETLIDMAKRARTQTHQAALTTIVDYLESLPKKD
jgi:UDP-N-acetylglucosamine--N-acetylmuramyl-(pentapeptide) pyrophosphoryl-undecaprenol N-acetylglucosamine transferase